MAASHLCRKELPKKFKKASFNKMTILYTPSVEQEKRSCCFRRFSLRCKKGNEFVSLHPERMSFWNFHRACVPSFRIQSSTACTGILPKNRVLRRWSLQRPINYTDFKMPSMS